MMKKDAIIVGLDVGTTKVSVVVAEVHDDGQIDIMGVGMTPSHGIKRGVVVDINQTMEAIGRAVREAENIAGCTVNTVYVGMSGGHLRSFNNRGVVTVQDGEVSEGDVQRVIDNARAVQIPADRQIIHTIPQEFLVDDNGGIQQPMGIMGVRLQVTVHVITALNSGVQNVTQCCTRAGLHVVGCNADLLASAVAVLEEDERDLGVALVDIGGGTTDIAVFHNGALVHSVVLSVGGDHVTSDIAVGFRTPKAEAERIKLKHGCALSSMVQEDELIDVACVGGRESVDRKRTLLCDIIEPRMEELFRLIEDELRASNFADVLGSGLVVTGGTALMPGVAELGEEVLNLPVRIGHPRAVLPAAEVRGGAPMAIGGLYELVKAPTFSTAMGLVLMGVGDNNLTEGKARRSSWKKSSGGRGSKIFGRIANWVSKAF